MGDATFRDFFLKPSCPRQRQYEALRAVFVDGLPQKEAAERFGYSYGAFRVLVAQFRTDCSEDSPPPFSSNRPKAARPAHRQANLPVQMNRPSPTGAP